MAKVTELRSAGAMRRRLLDLGIVEDTELRCIQRTASGALGAYQVRGTVIALRREDAQQIAIRPIAEGGNEDVYHSTGR